MRRNHWVSLRFSTTASRPPPTAVDHLLIGQDRHVDRVPVDQAFLAIDQAAPPQLQEPALLLAVIGRIAGGELPRPVDRQAQALQLLAHGRDVVVGPRLEGGRRAPWPRSRPACRRRPSPWGAGRCSPGRGGTGRSGRPWCSCAHGPCGCGPTARGTSTGRSTWGARRRRRCGRRPPFPRRPANGAPPLSDCIACSWPFATALRAGTGARRPPNAPRAPEISGRDQGFRLDRRSWRARVRMEFSMSTSV